MLTRLACLVAISLFWLTGCNRDRTSEIVGAMNTSNIQRLANLYAAYQNFKNGRGPASEPEFREFIRTYDPNKLKMMGINPDALDALFTSEVDGKAFKVRYTIGGGHGSLDPVVFEQDGKDGLKRVGFTGGEVQEVDETTARQLWSGRPITTHATGGRPNGIPAGAPTGPGQ
jgi:hypothetical protein